MEEKQTLDHISKFLTKKGLFIEKQQKNHSYFDIVARNPRTNQSFFIEVKSSKPILTSSLLRLSQFVKDDDKKGIVITPAGISINALSLAQKNHIDIIKNLDDFEKMDFDIITK